MPLQNQILGKPIVESQELDETEQSFTEVTRESKQTVQNETSGIRDKREETPKLRDFCQAAHYRRTSSLGSSCVKGWYYCYGYAEADCQLLSFGCLRNVPQYGYPKCSNPVYDFVNIDLGSKGIIQVRRTVDCQCV